MKIWTHMSTSARMALIVLAAGALVLAVLLVGFGGDDDDEWGQPGSDRARPAAPPPEEAPRDAAGNPMRDLTEIYARIPQDPQFAHLTTSEWEDLLFESDGGERWGTQEHYDELEAKLARVLEHVHRLKTDPGYRDLAKPAMPCHYNHLECSGPYRVFAGVREHMGTPLAKRQEAVAKRICERLADLHRRFWETLGEDQEPLPLGDPGGGEVLLVYLYFEWGEFQKYLGQIERSLPGNASTFFFPEDGWLTAHLSAPEAETGEAASPEEQAILREAVRQLLHRIRLEQLKRKHGSEFPRSEARTLGRCLWFTEGLAEFLVPRQEPIETWGVAREGKLPEWSLADLLAVRDGEELRRRSEEKEPVGGEPLTTQFRTQSWSWVHFLYYYEDGKYRDRFFEYAKREFLGDTGPEVFEKVWFGDGPVNWAGVEEEWLAYVEELLRRD